MNFLRGIGVYLLGKVSIAFVASVLVASAAYLGCYFVAVRPGVWLSGGGQWNAAERYPNVRGLTQQNLKGFFAVANQFDRRYVRPGLWSGAIDFYGATNRPGSGLQATANSTTQQVQESAR